jgi:hypothetical protein
LNKTSAVNRLAFAALVSVGVIFLVWLRLHQPPNTVDDAYITFRYARNIASGVGFVYNAGERVLGTTTPAYTLLLAALSRLSATIIRASLIVIPGQCGHILLLIRLVAPHVAMGRVGGGALFAIDGRI